MSRAWKFHNPEGLYFITSATVGWIDVFTRPAYKEIITDSLSYCIKEKGLVYLQDTVLGTDTFALWDPYISSAQDYYPFGMLMPNRVYTDTPLTEQIVIAVKTIERVVTTHEFANSTEGWLGTTNAVKHAETDRLRVEASAQDDWLYYKFDTDIGEDYRFVVTVTEGSCDSIKIGVQEVPNVLIEEHIVGTGTYEFEFTATTAATRLRIGRYNVNQQDTLNYYIDRVVLKRSYDTLVQDTIHVATGNGYRYAFNGKEQDPEWNDGGNMYDYGFRIYDPRIAKFLSVDPLAPSYPMLTPFQYASNSPVAHIDLDGLEAEYSAVLRDDGTVHIKIVYKVDVVDVVDMNPDQRKALLKNIKERSESSFSGVDKYGNEYSFELQILSTTVRDKPKNEYPENGITLELTDKIRIKQTGGNDRDDAVGRVGDASHTDDNGGIGSTQKNIAQVKISEFYLLDTRTGAHELGHTLGIRHPYDPDTHEGDDKSVENDGVAFSTNLMTQTSLLNDPLNAVDITIKQMNVVYTSISSDLNLYVVRSGDTLYGIAKTFGTSVDELARLNNISNIHAIDAGQELKLKE